MRRQSRAVLGLFLGCLSLCLSDLHAQPVTSAYGAGDAWGSYMGSQSQSNATLVNLIVSGDFSSGAPVWYNRAQAQTGFGSNGAYATSWYTYSADYNPFAPNPTATASYVLSWSTLDHSSSGNILNLSFSLSGNSSISGLQLGSFQFQYGTPYIIQSSLSVYTSYNSVGYALANSVWSDTFTIQGQPGGASGVAGFDVDLNGSISSISSNGPPFINFPAYPSVHELLTADFSNGASLDNVFLPPGASLTTDSGFPAIVTTPEPSAAALLLFSASALLLQRRRHQPR